MQYQPLWLLWGVIEGKSLTLIRLCCLCGTAIPSNPSSMCVNCIQTQVDITEGIPKQLTIQWCKGCER